MLALPQTRSAWRTATQAEQKTRFMQMTTWRFVLLIGVPQQRWRERPLLEIRGLPPQMRTLLKSRRSLLWQRGGNGKAACLRAPRHGRWGKPTAALRAQPAPWRARGRGRRQRGVRPASWTINGSPCRGWATWQHHRPHPAPWKRRHRRLCLK